MRIIIETIPYKKMRYPSAGDWFYDEDGTMVIKVADTKNWKYNSLVALHELVEFLLCKDHGISPKMVDDFDMGHPELEDPGADHRAPYKHEHKAATRLELAMAIEFGVSWKKYEKALAKL